MIDNELLKTLSVREQLSSKQTEQVKRYITLLLEWNAKFNLTSITEVPRILSHHFQDSWRVADFINVSDVHMVCDVGAGAGFPGLPLKIKFPHLKIILIEVNQKKVRFLQVVIKELGLTDVQVYPHDWRTFLRTTDYQVDFVLSRASLQPNELVRMFKPACHYNRAQLIYWASENWRPENKEVAYLQREEAYLIDNKKRKYVFFEAGRQQ